MKIIPFIEAVVQRKLDSQPPGIFSVCSANPYVLKTCMELAKSCGIPLLIEATCNQVNQFGGYTGLTPSQFAGYVNNLAVEHRLGIDNVLLGGDHLGPFAWKNEPAESAMAKSIDMIRYYVRAGFKKIHLDASPSCLDDPVPLPKEIIVERESLLCKAAVTENETLGKGLTDLVFVVGTEVPQAGGSPAQHESITISSIEETEENIHLTKNAFSRHNLDAAWSRTLAFVVQPGVEFSGSEVHAYDRQKAGHLSRLIEKFDQLVYEAHSTDYQSRLHLRQLVEDHFAILKVGPALTYALREALFALSDIEAEMYRDGTLEKSNLKQTLDEVMIANPKHWLNYYVGDAKSLEYQRKFSRLDRCRYYLSHPEVEKSIQILIRNLSARMIPLSLTRQFLPDQYFKVHDGRIKNRPLDLISGKIGDVVEGYISACFPN